MSIYGTCAHQQHMCQSDFFVSATRCSSNPNNQCELIITDKMLRERGLSVTLDATLPKQENKQVRKSEGD